MTFIKIFFLLGYIFLCNGCSLSYIMKQGYYQAKLLSSSVLIEYYLRNPSIPKLEREKLELVLDLRKFAHNNLHLNTQKNYRKISAGFDPVMYNITATKSLSFTPYLWWFPITGYVPYKGFFNKNDATNEQKSLENEGYEVYLGQISGYSTLGILEDPLWPSMLNLEKFQLADLLFHEMVHSTVYFPEHTDFNETLATFLAQEGVFAYFSQEQRKVQKFYERKRQYHNFFFNMHQDLQEVFNSQENEDTKHQKKSLIFQEYKEKSSTLLPNLKINWERVNNPFLLSFKRYNSENQELKKLFLMFNGNFQTVINFMKSIPENANPFESINTKIQASFYGAK